MCEFANCKADEVSLASYVPKPPAAQLGWEATPRIAYHGFSAVMEQARTPKTALTSVPHRSRHIVHGVSIFARHLGAHRNS